MTHRITAADIDRIRLMTENSDEHIAQLFNVEPIIINRLRRQDLYPLDKQRDDPWGIAETRQK